MAKDEEVKEVPMEENTVFPKEEPVTEKKPPKCIMVSDGVYRYEEAE